MLGRSPPVSTQKPRRRLSKMFPSPRAALCVCGDFPLVLLWDWRFFSWWWRNPWFRDLGLWERLPSHRHLWQSFRNVMPDVFEFIISSQTSCAPGHLKTVMSLSPLSRWYWSATMITTWTGTLAGMAILIVIGSGWLPCWSEAQRSHGVRSHLRRVQLGKRSVRGKLLLLRYYYV